MEEEFTTLGSAKLLITNITYEKALEVSKSLQSIDGISSVKFYDREDKDYENKKISDSYKNASALFILTFFEAKKIGSKLNAYPAIKFGEGHGGPGPCPGSRSAAGGAA